MNRRRILLLLAALVTISAEIRHSEQVAAQQAAQQPPRLARPQPQPLKVEALPRRLEEILKIWAQESAKIQKLQGNHSRLIYDNVFQVRKEAIGEFYYEAPDKGRIDIAAAKDVKQQLIKVGDKDFQCKPDRPEIWICNGKEIVRLDPTDKTGEVITIPEANQGANIMDGPLPFLFGMPPEQAKRRYKLKLLKEDEKTKTIHLHVEPRLQADAANYREANVILDAKSFLPTAVKLVDPGGNLETVYIFSNVEVNKPRRILQLFTGNDPFKMRWPGYKMMEPKPGEQLQAPGAGAGAAQPPQKFAEAPGPVIPSFIGLDWTKAQALLAQHGFKEGDWQVLPGKVAPNPQQVFRCYLQDPQPKSPRRPGQKIKLTFYVKPEAQTGQAQRSATGAK
jgi:TIGR03009 family protein